MPLRPRPTRSSSLPVAAKYADLLQFLRLVNCSVDATFFSLLVDHIIDPDMKMGWQLCENDSASLGF
jgi:hypothetical protein